jgi:hypothetical protein
MVSDDEISCKSCALERNGNRFCISFRFLATDYLVFDLVDLDVEHGLQHEEIQSCGHGHWTLTTF